MEPETESVITRSPDETEHRKWARIANGLRGQIETGELKAGNRISITYLSQERGVARQTAAKALRMLEREEKIKRYPGYGYLVLAPKKSEKKNEKKTPSATVPVLECGHESSTYADPAPEIGEYANCRQCRQMMRVISEKG